MATWLKLGIAVLLFSAGGCASQIFLDDTSSGDTGHIAAGATRKTIHVVSGTACDHATAAARFEIFEPTESGWTSRCASIEGFHYRAGSDYLLEVTEYAPTGTSSPRLVLGKVIEQRPHTQDWTH